MKNQTSVLRGMYQIKLVRIVKELVALGPQNWKNLRVFFLYVAGLATGRVEEDGCSCARAKKYDILQTLKGTECSTNSVENFGTL
jgi:hypothetical protein